jgi:hypothetical protein
MVDGCSSQGAPCDRTWAAVLVDPAYCGAPLGPTDQFSVFDCGGYHVLHRMEESASTDAYYDAASGALVAVIGPNENGTPICTFGPSTGFAPPASCPQTPYQIPAGWCSSDAGVDGARD